MYDSCIFCSAGLQPNGAAGREAEEIAAIADTLPDDPLERIRR